MGRKQMARRDFLKVSGATVGGLALLGSATQGSENGEKLTASVSRLSLDGLWGFQLDPLELGLKQEWFRPGATFDDTIRVPSSWQGQGKGYKTREGPGRTRVDYESFAGLDPKWPVTPGEYLGTAWYHRRVAIPESWNGSEIWLHFAGVHPASMFWLDGHLIGEHRQGPCHPFRVRVTPWLRPDAEHHLTVRVSEELRILQGLVKWPYFSGIFREVFLETSRSVWCEEVFIRSDIGHARVVAEATIGAATGIATPASVRVDMKVRPLTDPGKVASGDTEVSVQPGGEQTARVALEVENPRLWSPDSPFLYECGVLVSHDKEVMDSKTIRFGMREFRTEGKRVYLNGERLFLRGTGLAGCFQPFDPAPSTDPTYNRKLVRRIKEYGFNCLRWHTWPGDQDLLAAADEMGLLIQSELFQTFFEYPEEIQLTEDQWRAMIRRNRNHPCAFLWSMGNEENSRDPRYNALRDRLYDIAKELSPGTLVINTDGASLELRNLGKSDLTLISSTPAGSCLDMRYSPDFYTQITERPVVIHEMGYPETFPNPDEKSKFTGNIRPFWINDAMEVAAAKGNTELLPTFVRNSGRLFLTATRMAVEEVRKSKDLAGYTQWVFRDHLQEPAGLVDVFLDDKMTTASEFKKMNGPVALLMTPLRGYYTCFDGEAIPFSLHLSNHSASGFESATLTWELREGGTRHQIEERKVTAAASTVTDFGPFQVQPRLLGRPGKLTLSARFSKGETTVVNQWDFWTFPKGQLQASQRPVFLLHGVFVDDDRPAKRYPFIRLVREPQLPNLPVDSVLITMEMTQSVSSYLARGGRVMLLPGMYVREPGLPMLPSFFRPMANWTGTEGNTGTIISRHPVLADFPHEGYADLQFFDLLDGGRYPRPNAPFWDSVPGVYNLDPWPCAIEPIIRSNPNYKTGSNRAYLFEVQVGSAGTLLASSLRIYETLPDHPETQYLFDRMLRYVISDSFLPRAKVTVDQLDKLRRPVTFIAI